MGRSCQFDRKNASRIHYRNHGSNIVKKQLASSLMNGVKKHCTDISFFAYPSDIRKVITTTNAIESLNMSLRKVTKNRGSFPNEEAMSKLLYLALNNIVKIWTMPIKDWKAAMNRFSILFEDRMPSF
jgi:transposase-like protein